MALAVEEGMIRNIANRVTSDGIGAFDVELGDFQAVGQIIDQVYKRIAYESIIGTARTGGVLTGQRLPRFRDGHVYCSMGGTIHAPAGEKAGKS